MRTEKLKYIINMLEAKINIKDIKPEPLRISFNSGQKVVNIPLYNSNIEKYTKRHSYITSCVNALKETNPYEKVIIYESKTQNHIATICGNNNSCEIPSKLLRHGDYSIVHGHPALKSGLTPPVSFQDFILLNNTRCLSEITALDKNGKESVLKKTNSFKKLNMKELERLKVIFTEYLIENSNEAEKQKIKALLNFCNTHTNNIIEKQQIAELLDKVQYTNSGVKAIDLFWRENALQIGLEYTPFIK